MWEVATTCGNSNEYAEGLWKVPTTCGNWFRDRMVTEGRNLVLFSRREGDRRSNLGYKE